MNKKVFFLLCFLIIALSAGLRFARFFDRWGLAYDQAHDAVVARYALTSGQIPLLGPFSSAGPFQTSGVWYWFIMVGTQFYPAAVITPWVILTTLYILFVLGMIILGTLIINRRFGILVGLLTAVSTAQIAQSVSLTNQSPVALTSLCALLGFTLYAKHRKSRYLFLLGFFVSLSASIHLQGVSLGILVLLSLFLFRVSKPNDFIALFLGLLLPFIPIAIFDVSHNFINSKNMLHYVFVDQYRISLDVLGRRWKTFITIFIPTEWAHIIGGRFFVGGMLLVGSAIAPFFLPLEKVSKKIILGILVSTFCMFSILRYTRTPLFSSYLVFLHPFILLLSSLFVYLMLQKIKIFGIISLIIIVGLSFQKSIEEITYGYNLSDQRARYWVSVIWAKNPTDLFSVYDFHHETIDASLMLSLYLDSHSKIGNNGRKLAVLSYPPQATPSGELVLHDGSFSLYDVSASSSATLERLGWARVNPEDIYDATEHWSDPKK